MKKIILYLIIIVPFLGFSQQKITLNECYTLVEKNYPLAKQTNLIQQKSTLEIDALNKAKLPKMDINAQATYQSDVIGLPMTLPGVEGLNKDQYRATLDVNQLIYNGGMIDANSKLKEAQTKTLQQQVAVNLYQLKSRINYSYMMILLFQDQRELLEAKQNTINSKIKEVKSGVKNGAILPASEQVLEAELLKLEQALTENSFQRIKELQNLSSLTTTTFAENTILEKPITIIDNNGTRPEIQFFESQQNQIEASKNVISKSNLP
uniref:TolC family protein n=1 Tax=Flavobacterium sp. TaxID=239 RepID=UPI00404AD278